MTRTIHELEEREDQIASAFAFGICGGLGLLMLVIALIRAWVISTG